MPDYAPVPPTRHDCPACRTARDLTEHRDASAAEWSVRRATLSFAIIIAERNCPLWTGSGDAA